MTKWFARSAAVLMLGIVGCSGMQKGIGVSTYDKGTTPNMAKATADGEYALYPAAGAEPKQSYYLHMGDPLGFKYGKTGEIIGVAGDAEVVVPDGDYVWKRR